MAEIRDAGVGYHDGIASQLTAALTQERAQARAPDFLLAFDDKRQIARQRGAGLEVGFHCLEVREVLALVVAGAPAEEQAALDARLEGGELPQVQRLGGLDIVVAIDEKVRPAARWAARCLGEDDRMPGRRKEAGLQADLATVVGEPLGAAPHVGAVGRLCRDAGQPHVLTELADETVLILLQVRQQGLHVPLSLRQRRAGREARKQGRRGVGPGVFRPWPPE